jgi:hypothetical protein
MKHSELVSVLARPVALARPGRPADVGVDPAVQLLPPRQARGPHPKLLVAVAGRPRVLLVSAQRLTRDPRAHAPAGVPGLYAPRLPAEGRPADRTAKQARSSRRTRERCSRS